MRIICVPEALTESTKVAVGMELPLVSYVKSLLLSCEAVRFLGNLGCEEEAESMRSETEEFLGFRRNAEDINALMGWNGDWKGTGGRMLTTFRHDKQNKAKPCPCLS